MDDTRWDALARAATAARANAYAPYSQFAVGAVLRSTNGNVFVGCNVENASFGATICAERAALAAAVAAGEREFDALAIVSGAKDPTPPCGICRQALAELAPDLAIRSFTGDRYEDYVLNELLPDAFDARQLE